MRSKSFQQQRGNTQRSEGNAYPSTLVTTARCRHDVLSASSRSTEGDGFLFLPSGGDMIYVVGTKEEPSVSSSLSPLSSSSSTPSLELGPDDLDRRRSGLGRPTSPVPLGMTHHLSHSGGLSRMASRAPSACSIQTEGGRPGPSSEWNRVCMIHASCSSSMAVRWRRPVSWTPLNNQNGYCRACKGATRSREKLSATMRPSRPFSAKYLISWSTDSEAFPAGQLVHPSCFSAGAAGSQSQAEPRGVLTSTQRGCHSFTWE